MNLKCFLMMVKFNHHKRKIPTNLFNLLLKNYGASLRNRKAFKPLQDLDSASGSVPQLDLRVQKEAEKFGDIVQVRISLPWLA